MIAIHTVRALLFLSALISAYSHFPSQASAQAISQTATKGQVSKSGRLNDAGLFKGRIYPVFDIDSYAFNARQGEGVDLRMVDLEGFGLDPYMKVFGPNSVLLYSDWSSTVAGISFSAPLTGVYSVVVEDYGSSGPSTGAYEIHFTRAPGANEHGSLVNGGNVSGVIDLGDLDSYTFNATVGDGIDLRMVDLGGTGLDPYMKIYDPNGLLYASNWASSVAGISFSAPMTGVYTLVATDYGSSGPSTGAYEIHFTRAPGANEHGSLVNGGNVSGVIDLGDLDSYIFSATVGDGIDLQMTDLGLTGLDPYMKVYDPNGLLYYSDWSSTIASISFSAPMTGVYTLVATDYGSSGPSTGAYDLFFLRF